jgi:putative transposase
LWAWTGNGRPWTAPWSNPPLGAECSGANPTDRAKRGVKRSLLVEGHGVPVGLALEGANRHDCKLVVATLRSVPVRCARRKRLAKAAQQNLCLDKGYDFPQVRLDARRHGYKPHVRSRGEERWRRKTKKGSKARRWVVERTHSWINRFRALLIRWNKKAANYAALLHLGFAIITLRCCHVLG